MTGPVIRSDPLGRAGRTPLPLPSPETLSPTFAPLHAASPHLHLCTASPISPCPHVTVPTCPLSRFTRVHFCTFARGFAAFAPLHCLSHVPMSPCPHAPMPTCPLATTSRSGRVERPRSTAADQPWPTTVSQGRDVLTPYHYSAIVALVFRQRSSSP